MAASARAISSRFKRAEWQAHRRSEHERTQPQLVQQLAGELARLGVLGVGADAEDRFGEADLALGVRADHDVLQQGHRREQGEVLERASDAEAGDPVGGGVDQVLPFEHHPPGGRLVDAADDVEHRGLASTVRADQTTDLTFVDVERQSVERHDPAEADGHVLYFEQTQADLIPL